MISTQSAVNDDFDQEFSNHFIPSDANQLVQNIDFQNALQMSDTRRNMMTPRRPPRTAMRSGLTSGFQQTAAGRPRTGFRPATGYRPGTGFRPGTGLRPATGYRPGTGFRPMTAVRGAGYTSSRQGTFDPLNMGSSSRGPAPPLEPGKEENPEEKIKTAERKIMELIESSAEAVSKNDMKVALERAREASSRERVLIRLQEQAGLSDNHNVDLTFTVLFNLAIQYTNNEMYTEAIATYQAITRNKMFSNSARLKVNMGNIYVKIGQLSQAIKMYRMALDQAPGTQKDLRIKIMHNIGMLFVQMGRLEEAANSFEWVMRERAEFKAGLHAILCHFALGHRDKMKRGFLELLEVQLNIDQEDKYSISTDDAAINYLNEVIKTDELSVLESDMKAEAEKTILNAAKLIAPVIEDSLTVGFAWCVDAIRSSGYGPLAADLEINKAMVLLHNRQITLAIDTLKMFENRDTKSNSAASTMLSFIYYLQGDYEQAERCAEAARNVNSNNAAAYVNLSACAIKKGELEKARELLEYTLEINQPDHVQTLYNLGLVYKKLGEYEDALECFEKIQNLVRHDPQTLCQLGHVNQLLKDSDQALEWYNQLLGIVPWDPGVLQKLGEVYDTLGDKQQAYQYYYDSYRYFSGSFEVIDWLGSYFISMQVAEKALPYFQRAVELAPDQPRWRLLVAACLRRTGQFHKALEEYQDIHDKFPENIECLKFLIRLCSDLGLKEAQMYASELKRAEKARELKERLGSGRPGTTSSRRSNSGNSSRAGSGISVQSSPIANRKENRTSHGGGHAHFNRMNTLDRLDNSTPEPQNDAIYSDPVGPLPLRPMTAAGKRDEDFGDEELGDDLLPV